jgi:hypothetical protein
MYRGPLTKPRLGGLCRYAGFIQRSVELNTLSTRLRRHKRQVVTTSELSRQTVCARRHASEAAGKEVDRFEII